MNRYRINEIFYSLQGEGVRAGTAALFLRFSGCNLQCRVETEGFDCDTDFEARTLMTSSEIIARLRMLSPECAWVILTGGEPALQLDRGLIDALHTAGYKLAIETNGTIALPDGLDWITVSPKSAEDAIRQRRADEVKYVRRAGQPLSETVVDAPNKLISPAFDANRLDPAALAWCIQLVKDNPGWRLSVQMHKSWNIR